MKAGSQRKSRVMKKAPNPSPVAQSTVEAIRRADFWIGEKKQGTALRELLNFLRDHGDNENLPAVRGKIRQILEISRKAGQTIGLAEKLETLGMVDDAVKIYLSRNLKQEAIDALRKAGREDDARKLAEEK